MVEMVFFKKYDPRIALNSTRGRRIEFQDIGGQWGILATEDNFLIRELRTAQAEQRGGVMEISAAEYEEIKKKDNRNFSWTSRETVGRQQLKRLFARANENAVAASRLPPGVKSQFSAPRVLVKSQGPSNIVVKTVRR